jgi:hypothetical protein
MLGHKRVRTTEAVTNFGWAILQHPLYSHELTSSKYHLFGSLKESLQGCHYTKGMALHNATPGASAARATPTRWKYVCMFKGGRRLLTKMETALKSDYVFIIIVKLCKVFACPACK